MSKIIKGLRQAVEFEKCRHDYVEGAAVKGRRVLRCMKCKTVVHIIDEPQEHEPD